MLMLRLHRIATGMFSASIPREVEKLPPYKEAILSISMATPVKPLDKRSAGRMNTWITNACRSADIVTARIVIVLRTAG